MLKDTYAAQRLAVTGSSDLQGSPHTVLYLHVCACVHLCVLEWQSEAEVSFTWSLSPLLFVACCDNGLKAEIKENLSKWEFGTKMSKGQGFFSNVDCRHCTLMLFMCCNLDESSIKVCYYRLLFFDALYLECDALQMIRGIL